MNRYSEARAQAAEFVKDWARTGPVLVLAPVRMAAEEVVRVACTNSLIGVQGRAFRGFVVDLAEEEVYRLQLTPVGRVVREALAARVTRALLRSGRLTYFAPVAGFPGFPRALTATLEELRLDGITPEQLADTGASGPDLGRLLEAYTAELTARRLADHALRVQLAAGILTAGAGDIRHLALAAIDLAPRSRIERQLLGAMLSSARAHLDLHLSPGKAPPASRLESLQRFLFSSETVPVRADDGSVEIFSTSGEALECVEIARRLNAAAEAGTPFDQAAILLRSPDRHQPLVAEALRRAGIPALYSQGSRLPDVAGRSFLALLHCASEGLSASRFAEYLSLGQLPEGEEAHTPVQWERHLVDAAVIGGVERWATRLTGLREELRGRHAAESEEAVRSVLERDIASLENLEALALPLIRRLAALPREARWGEWIEALIGVAEASLRAPERVLELLEALEPLSDLGPIGLPDVLLVLGPHLNSLRAAPAETRYGKLWVGTIDEARGLAFRIVFVPGLNEGLFPRPPADDPLLPQAQRETLGLAARPEDAELLGVAAACATERLSLSFSRLDLLTGRERVPSFYAFAAHRAAGGREMEVREFEALARSATETRIGWPAPAAARDAIDDAEFDLATLAPRLPGSALYLKKLPGRSVEALRSRWTRWHKPWKAADGLMVEEIGSDELSRYRLTARAWSPSALQQYARCPYRFALQGIHGLRPARRAAALQRMDRATRGTITHAVQFEVLRDLRQRGLLPVAPATLPAALERLDAALRLIAKRAEAELAPAIPQIWLAEVAALRADLRGWLQHKASHEADWTPEYFELSFGLADRGGRDSHSSPDSVVLDGGFRLRGSIDMVERHRSGIRRVVDHKTGRVPEPRPQITGGGEVLQPALYAMAAEKLLGGNIAFGRLFYSTIRQNYAAIDVPLDALTRSRAVQALTAIDTALRDGVLPAAPRKDGCKGCEYVPVCGPYEEERVLEKSQPELKALKDLRGWR
jgi:ATP-dependent helicase/nuclease subunit B